MHPPLPDPDVSAVGAVITAAVRTRTETRAMIPAATPMRTRAVVPARTRGVVPGQIRGWTRAAARRMRVAVAHRTRVVVARWIRGPIPG